MTDLIVVYEYGVRICTFTSTMLSDPDASGVPSRTAELVRGFFDSHSAVDGKVHIELATALRGEILDARRTEVFFLIAAALIKSGAWYALSAETRRAFSPYIRARKAAAKIRIARLGRLREFVRVCRVSMECEKRGMITPDEALTRMINALPPVSAIRMECTSDPDIHEILAAVAGFARMMPDKSYYEALSEYIDSVSGKEDI